MKSSIKNLVLVAFIFVVAQYFVGCCFIGAGIGASNDAKKPDYTTIALDNNSTMLTEISVDEIRSPIKGNLYNQTVVVTTRDNKVLSGRFREVVKKDDKIYMQITMAHFALCSDVVKSLTLCEYRSWQSMIAVTALLPQNLAASTVGGRGRFAGPTGMMR